MATKLWITQYTTVGNDGRKTIPAPHEPAIKMLSLDIAGTSAAMTEDFNDGCGLVVLYADADCHIKFADADTPVADKTTCRKIGAGEKAFSIDPSVTRRLAVIAADAVS